jgi:type VI secretion system secreted protein VgrG
MVKNTFSIRAGDEFKIDVGNGASSLSMKKDGSILIKGKTIKLEASDHIWANGHLVDIN